MHALVTLLSKHHCQNGHSVRRIIIVSMDFINCVCGETCSGKELYFEHALNCQTIRKAINEQKTKKQKSIIKCGLCGKSLSALYFQTHMKFHYGNFFHARISFFP